MIDSETYRKNLQTYLRENSALELVTELPAESGVCRIANVSPSEYDPTFVSMAPGRWNNAGEANQYFANSFDIASLECGYPSGEGIDDKVFELHRTTQPIQAIDVSKLPQELRQPLYQDEHPVTKWNLARVFIEEVRGAPDCSDIAAVYAPSASGLSRNIGGACLMATPLQQYTECVATGTSNDWEFGTINYLE